MPNILVLQCNPNTDSFGAHMAHEYTRSAEANGHTVKYFDTAKLQFDHNLVPRITDEPVVLEQREIISWADHVVVVSPVWWMSYPANFKAYLDRVMASGFAYKYPHHNFLLGKFLPEPLLKGRSLRLITTQDGPRWSFWLVGNPFALADRFLIYRLMGFRYRRTPVASVHKLSTSKREKILSKIARLGKVGK